MEDSDLETCQILQSLAQQTSPQESRDERRTRVVDRKPSWWKAGTMKHEPGWGQKRPRLADRFYYETLSRL